MGPTVPARQAPPPSHGPGGEVNWPWLSWICCHPKFQSLCFGFSRFQLCLFQSCFGFDWTLLCLRGHASPSMIHTVPRRWSKSGCCRTTQDLYRKIKKERHRKAAKHVGTATQCLWMYFVYDFYHIVVSDLFRQSTHEWWEFLIWWIRSKQYLNWRLAP